MAFYEQHAKRFYRLPKLAVVGSNPITRSRSLSLA